jgi:nucleotide-binding universal stress UspA family protein
MEEAEMTDCLVCAVDDTEHGLNVARVAGRLSRALDLRVVLVHVSAPRPSAVVPSTAALPSPVAPENIPADESMRNAFESEADAAQSLLERTADVELLFGAELRAEVGDPAARILAVAEAEEAELVVLGSRRRGSLATMFLGSVSRDVLNGAPCPVVVVPEGVEVPAPRALESMSVS